MRKEIMSAGRIAAGIAATSRTICSDAADYSVEYSLYSAMSRCLDFRRTPNRLTYFVMNRRRWSILKVLRMKFAAVVDAYQAVDADLQGNDAKGRIWVFWWQGEQDAPALVKKCIASIRRNSGAHDVVVLTKENYFDYVSIPEYILDKHDDGTITHNAFANLLRVMLLERKGGAWLDATIYVSGPIDEAVFRYPFYTNKVIYHQPGRFDHAKWSTYFLAGEKGNVLFRFVRDCYFQHWKEERLQIDYFLFDYFIWLAYETIPGVRKMIDHVPCNNPCILSVQKVLGAKFNAEVYQEYTRDTYLHKLTWKASFAPVTENNEKTFYGYLLEHEP